MDECRQRWRSAWGRKAGRSFHARLQQWQAFLADYRSKETDHTDRYATEVRVRVLLALLQPEMDSDHEADQKLLAMLDMTLRSVFVPGEFIWEQELSAVFPADTYWFLYGNLKR